MYTYDTDLRWLVKCYGTSLRWLVDNTYFIGFVLTLDTGKLSRLVFS